MRNSSCFGLDVGYYVLAEENFCGFLKDLFN